MAVRSYIKLVLISALFACQVHAQKYSEVQLGKIRYANKVLAQAIKEKDSLQIAEAYYLLGKVEANAGNYLTSQNLFIKSIGIQEKYGESFKLGRLYLRLQENELSQGHYTEAYKYLNIAYGIFQRIKSDSGLARVYGGFGGYYANTIHRLPGKPISAIKPNYDSAIHYFNKSKDYSYKLKDTSALAELNRVLGEMYEIQGKPIAINYYKVALKFNLKNNKKSETVVSMLSLASAYLLAKQPGEANKMIVQAQKIYDQHLLHEYHTKRLFEDVYVRYYEFIGNWKEACKHLKLKHELEKRDLLADNEGAVSRLNVEFETQKKEGLLKEQTNKLELQEENASIQRKFLLTLSILLVVTIGLSFVFFRLYRKNQRISKRNEVLVNEQNHRVKNNLQVVSSLLHLQSKRLNDMAARQAVEESMLRIEAMAILQRKLYDQDELAMVSLSDYLMELTDEVLKTFDCADIETEFKLEKVKLSADQAMAVGLIVTELITNACKYAFVTSNEPTLSVISSLENENLIVTVKDNGPGFSVQHSGKTRTFGMRLIQIQTNQLKGDFYFDFSEGTKFILKFKPDLS